MTEGAYLFCGFLLGLLVSILFADRRESLDLQELARSLDNDESYVISIGREKISFDDPSEAWKNT